MREGVVRVALGHHPQEGPGSQIEERNIKKWGYDVVETGRLGGIQRGGGVQGLFRRGKFRAGGGGGGGDVAKGKVSPSSLKRNFSHKIIPNRTPCVT